MENAQNGSETWENIHSATVWSNQVWWMGSGNNFSLLFPGNLIYDRVQENGISVLCLNWHCLLFTWKIQEYEKLAVTLNEARHELSDKVRELSRSASRASLVEEAERHSQSLQELAKQLEEWGGNLGSAIVVEMGCWCRPRIFTFTFTNDPTTSSRNHTHCVTQAKHTSFRELWQNLSNWCLYHYLVYYMEVLQSRKSPLAANMSERAGKHQKKTCIRGGPFLRLPRSWASHFPH